MKKSNISIFDYEAISDYRHILYTKQKQSDNFLVIFYNANTEEELFSARCSYGFWAGILKVFSKQPYSKIELVSKTDQPFFCYKRFFLNTHFTLFDLLKNQVGSLSPSSFSSSATKVCIDLKKHGENLEFHSTDNTLIGMKREGVLSQKFKPSGSIQSHRNYDGEIIFYQNPLAITVKVGLLGSVFL